MRKEYPVPYIDHPTSGRIGFVNGNNAGQTPLALYEFQKILPEFDIIIEIGYHRGGTTEWFHLHKREDAQLVAYDITNRHRTNTNPDIDFRLANCFGPALNEIRELIQSDKRVMIFCDGGNKPHEFNTFSAFLKSNDVIFVHDYWDDTLPEPYNSFPESEGWLYGVECKYSEIKQSIQKYELDGFHYDDFRRVLIGSFIKK